MNVRHLSALTVATLFAALSCASSRPATPPPDPAAPAAGPAPAPTASAAPTAAAGTPLVGTRWRLVELDGKPVTVDGAARAANIRLEADRSLQGYGGCNTMRGTWSAPADTADMGTRGPLRFGTIGATRRACIGPTPEPAFFRALEATQRFELSGSTLTLFDDATARARFERDLE